MNREILAKEIMLAAISTGRFYEDDVGYNTYNLEKMVDGSFMMADCFLHRSNLHRKQLKNLEQLSEFKDLSKIK